MLRSLAPPAPPRFPHGTDAPARKRVLVVEDERIVALDLRGALEALGYAVVGVAASADDALRIAADAAPDLVLMDIRIAGSKDGIETARALRDVHRIPVVYLTANADDSTLARALATEPVGYLVKPYNQLSLRTTIEVAFRRLESERSVRHAHAEEKARLEDQHAETRRRADRLGIEATTDPLTGLSNRRHLEHVFSREMSFGVRAGHPVGLILLDLDRFKRLNDTFGHAAGDAVLVAVAAFLRARLRTYDIACRYGGEEIVIIVPGAQTSAAVTLAEHLRAGIGQLAVPALGGAAVGLGPTVTASFGVSSFPTHGTELDQVFHAADVALYRAKAAGRNRVVAAALPTGAADRVLASGNFDR